MTPASPLLEAVFWGAAGTVAYAYLGYPALLALLARPRAPRGSEALPSLTMIVAAYNEESCIEAKVRNTLEHDYPPDRLDVIVVSDGSTDKTSEKVQALGDPRVQLLVQPSRQGKNLALNRGVAAARGEIVVFTDANAMLTAGSLLRLAAPFADPAVALVSGQGLYTRSDGGTEGVSNAYARYEQFLKEREAALGFVAAADGALYAMRRSAFETLAAKEVHDLVHPIQTALSGRRSAFVPGATTLEPPSASAGREYDRHVRIIAQGLPVYVSAAPRLLVKGRLLEAWMLTSHRFLRWTSASALAAALVANLFLLDRPLFQVTLGLQLLFYAAAAGGALRDGRRSSRLLQLPYYFCVVSAAGARAMFDFMRGRRHESWVPTGGR